MDASASYEWGGPAIVWRCARTGRENFENEYVLKVIHTQLFMLHLYGVKLEGKLKEIIASKPMSLHRGLVVWEEKGVSF